MGGCISECKWKGRAYNNDCFDRFRVSDLQKGNYILSGFHHKSMRYKIASNRTIMEQINGLYLDKKYCTYTKI